MGAVASCCGHDEHGSNLTAEELLRVSGSPGDGIKYPANDDQASKGKGVVNGVVDGGTSGSGYSDGGIHSARTSASPVTSISMADIQKVVNGSSGEEPIVKTPREIAAWQQKAEKGTNVNVVFPDGHRITCDFQLDMENNKAIFLTFNEKVRSIPLSDIATVLYGADCEQLDESERELLLDNQVVGIKLRSSGRAIAFSFLGLHDAHCFVHFCRQMSTK